MKMKIKKLLPLIILGAFILGIIGGFIIPKLFTSISFIGTIYINLLKLMIIPILFTGITVALASNKEHISRITIKSIILFIVMFVISFILIYGLCSIIKPGEGFEFSEIAWESDLTDASIAGFFTSLIPSNILSSMSNNAILPTIIFAFIFGIALRKTNSEKIIQGMTELNNAFGRMLEYFMWITPIGVFALIGNSIATFGSEILASCAIYIGVAYAGCLLIMLLVMILPVWIFAKINPIVYIKNIAQIWITTLSTCSSAATLPTTIKMCNEKFHIPDHITNIVVPLGCTIHMCGGAVSFCLLAMFNMQMYGIPMTFGLFLLMLFSATLINMGAPGIPGGGIVIGATYLSILNIPLNFIGVYAGIYRILDMAYTTMNVNGDITANILIKKSEEKHID